MANDNSALSRLATDLWVGFSDAIGSAVDWIGGGVSGYTGGIASNIVLGIDTTSAGMVEKGHATFINAFGTFITSALIISLILFGLGMLMGWIEYPLKELGKKVLVWSVLLGLFYNWDFFDLVFYQMFTTAPQALAGMMVGAMDVEGDGSVIGLLDGFMERAWRAGSDIAAGGGYFVKWIMYAVVILGSVVIAGYALGLICLAKIGLSIVLMMGPLFIVFYMFESTKHMFQSWLQQVLNYCLISILVSVVMAFFLSMLDNAIPLPQEGKAIGFSDLASFMLLGVVMMLVLFQVQTTASGLAGGLQLSTLGTFSSGGQMGREAAGSTGRGASAAYKRLRGLRAGNTVKGE